MAQELAVRGVSVVAFDPAGIKNSSAVLDGRVRFAASARECIGEADVVVVATPWSEFCAIPPEEWRRLGSPRTVIDCWRTLETLRHSNGIRYFCLGQGEVPLNQSLLTTEAEVLQRR